MGIVMFKFRYSILFREEEVDVEVSELAAMLCYSLQPR
jgi:hypothetical protein